MSKTSCAMGYAVREMYNLMRRAGTFRRIQMYGEYAERAVSVGDAGQDARHWDRYLPETFEKLEETPAPLFLGE